MATLDPIQPVSCEFEEVGSTLHGSIQLVLSHSQMTPHQLERRRDRRYPFPYPIRITPLEDDGQTICGDPITVLGRHLTEHGVDFYFREPLPYRWVLATFDCGDHGSVSLLLELTWCRFGHHGYYENGGRFVRGCTAKQIVA